MGKHLRLPSLPEPTPKRMFELKEEIWHILNLMGQWEIWRMVNFMTRITACKESRGNKTDIIFNVSTRTSSEEKTMVFSSLFYILFLNFIQSSFKSDTSLDHPIFCTDTDIYIVQIPITIIIIIINKRLSITRNNHLRRQPIRRRLVIPSEPSLWTLLIVHVTLPIYL